jgi:hypothetical protein
MTTAVMQVGPAINLCNKGKLAAQVVQLPQGWVLKVTPHYPRLS